MLEGLEKLLGARWLPPICAGVVIVMADVPLLVAIPAAIIFVNWDYRLERLSTQQDGG